MKIPRFEMERMQSTWENVVEMDMSESGIRPVTLRELAAMGLDLDAILDMPLGYSQSNGTVPLRESLAEIYPGATPDNIEVTNGTSEANYLLALSLLREGDQLAFEVPNYMQLWGVPKSLGAFVNCFRLRIDENWEPDWDEFERAVNDKTRLVYVSNPNNPSGAVLSETAMRRIVARCDHVGAYLLADEVYQGAEVYRARTPTFWGMSDRVIVTSGLSKAYGIPGVRIGWTVGPDRCDRGVLDAARLSHHRTQQDLRRRGACRGPARQSRTAVRPHPRHPARKPAHHACLGRELRRLPYLPRAGSRRPLPDALPIRHAQLRSLRAHPPQPKRPHRAGRAPRPRRLYSCMAGRQARVSR